MAKQEDRAKKPALPKSSQRGQADDRSKKWNQLVAQAWADSKLKRRLVDNPGKILKEHGIDAPPGVEIRVVENTDKVLYLTLPVKPAEAVTELTAREMAAVKGGTIAVGTPVPVTPRKRSWREEEGFSVDCNW